VDVALTSEESSALRTALHSYLSDLQMEIANTDDRHYRDGLKEERVALEGIVAKLEAARGSSELRDEQGREVVRIVALWVTDDIG
jgi:hypothetical protein